MTKHSIRDVVLNDKPAPTTYFFSHDGERDYGIYKGRSYIWSAYTKEGARNIVNRLNAGELYESVIGPLERACERRQEEAERRREEELQREIDSWYQDDW